MKNYLNVALLLILFTSCEKENTPITIENYLGEKMVSQIMTNPDGSKVFFLSGVPDLDNDQLQFRCYVPYVYQLSCTDGEHSLYFENLHSIGDITVDNNCNLYACMMNKIVKFTPPNDSTSVLNIPYFFSSLAADTSGKLWAGTSGGGLYYFDKYTWHHYTNKNSSLTGNEISKIDVGKNNDVWLSVDGDTCSLISISQGVWKTYEWAGLSGDDVNYISSLAVDKNGTAWISYYYGSSYKLATLNKNGILSMQTPGFLVGKNISFLRSDYAGNIIISVADANNAQIYIYSGTQWNKLVLGKEYPYIYDVNVDARDNVWIGTPKGAYKCNLQLVP